jgi:BirA family biotin operon repressor/biotin-[acetyl-CoA-carboxylase] ligase
LPFGNIQAILSHPTCKSNQKLLYKIFANTLFTGQQLVFVPECHSTNSLASELASKNILSDGTVIITSNQTAGRGQRGNSWETTAGMNLTFSILLKPTFLSVKNQFNLTIITSLSVVDFLKEQSVAVVKIKWPNDILADKKKICGILIENSVQQENIQQSIVGIGLNINQNNFSSPNATSLGVVTNKTFDLNALLNSLLEKFEKRYLQLRSGKQAELKIEYLENLFGFAETQTFISNGKEFEGTIEGVDERGELKVSDNGIISSYKLKEIALRY